MFHIQTLCSRAIWLDHGRLRMQGDSFDVTREYLTFHEERSRRERPVVATAPGDTPRILDCWLEDGAGREMTTFAFGEEVVMEGVAHGPDARAPVVLFGIVRADGTPVFGTHSNESGFHPHAAGEGRFTFRLKLAAISLLPGKYALRLHAMDPEGLRLFDTVEKEFVVTGRTRDYGLVRLEHEWSAGRGRRSGG
jgi:lipopolysaccharide transport system ATP-binding protein